MRSIEDTKLTKTLRVSCASLVIFAGLLAQIYATENSRQQNNEVIHVIVPRLHEDIENPAERNGLIHEAVKRIQQPTLIREVNEALNSYMRTPSVISALIGSSKLLLGNGDSILLNFIDTILSLKLRAIY